MHVTLIGLFAADYMIALANGLSHDCKVDLFLSRQNIAVRFPEISDGLEVALHQQRIIDPSISIHWIDYPIGQYHKKVALTAEITRTIFQLHPGIIHYQSGGTPWLLFAMPWLRKYPLVTTIHDAAHHPGDKPPKLVHTAVNAFLTRQTHLIIVHGRQQAQLLTQKYHVRSDDNKKNFKKIKLENLVVLKN